MIELLLGVPVKYSIGMGEMTLFGKKIYLVGASDERAEGRIRGASFCAALVDEVTILPESFFRMLFSRLSVPDAKLFGSSNPDSSFHWLKTDFIDRAEELDAAIFEFTLEDNPSLSKDFVDSLKKEYTGLWYSRFIEGKWVQAEGAVYSMFNKDFHVISMPPQIASEYYLGIDYGTSNACCFLLIGFCPYSYPNIWVEREYYWDSRKTGYQKTDAEYADDLMNFVQDVTLSGCYIDPSAASFKIELRRRKLYWFPKDAKHEVIDGIRLVSSLLLSGTLKVCKGCSNLIREFESYVWDEKAQKRGIDAPKKEFDHCLDSARYVIASRFANGLNYYKREEPPSQGNIHGNPMGW